MQVRYTRGDLDFTAQLGRIKASPAQALVEWSRYAEGALVAKQFAQMNMSMPRFGCDGVAIPKYVDLGGDAVNGVFYTTHYSSSATAANIPAAQAFITNFQKAYSKVPDMYNAEAYDAITVALLAIEHAGSEDRAAVRDALSKATFDSVRGPLKFMVPQGRSALDNARGENCRRQRDERPASPYSNKPGIYRKDMRACM